MVTIIDQAQPGKSPVRPNKTLNIILGIVIGLMVGVGLAFFIEYLDTSVKTIDDVERALQAPVLGVIPQNVGYLIDEGAESQHAEAYRVLRTNLLFSRKDDRLNTIVVVSAGAGEGKSTTVLNLATVFAQAGQRVLMVDSDLRRPTLHKVLKVSNSLGLDQLSAQAEHPGRGHPDGPAFRRSIFMASGKLPSSSMSILGSASDEGHDRRIEAALRFCVLRFAAHHGRERRLHSGQRGGHGHPGHPIPPLPAADEHPRQADD